MESSFRINNSGVVLVDTSYINVRGLTNNLITTLSENPLNALRELPLDLSYRFQERSDETLNPKVYGEVLATEEVETELKERLRLLKERVNHIQELKQGKHIRNDGTLSAHIWDERLNPQFSQLTNYLAQFDNIVNYLSDTCPRGTFTPKQNDIYYEILAHAEQAKEETQRENKKRDNPSLGDRLGTDQKIIATAYTLAESRPVLIKTADWDIHQIAKRTQELINNSPPFQILLYGVKKPGKKNGKIKTRELNPGIEKLRLAS